LTEHSNHLSRYIQAEFVLSEQIINAMLVIRTIQQRVLLATGRLSLTSGGVLHDGTDLGTYRFNLLDFPKGTGNIIQDGHTLLHSD
jgi:hypothetical protein